MVNPTVLSQHAEEAPFQWTQRERATSQAHYTLDALTRLDDRLEAHLEGLRVNADAGWQVARASLMSIEAEVMFVLGVLAFSGDSSDRVHDALVAAGTSDGADRGLLSALAWLGTSNSSRWVRALLQARAPEYRRLAIAALGLQRSASVSDVIPVLTDSDASLRARALRVIGECKLTDLAEPIRELLRDDDDVCRFWAARTLTLLGDRNGLDALIAYVEQLGPRAWQAMQLGLRSAPLQRAREVVRNLAGNARSERLAIAAAGVVGDPQALPWLLAKMENPLLAKLAGEAFSAMTGVDLNYENLAQEPVQDDSDESAVDDRLQQNDLLPAGHEDSLPLPDVTKLVDWWRSHNIRFAPNERYLCGQPIGVANAVRVLKRGRQRDRAAAALELALLQPQAMLFDVQARGRLQKRWLAQWNS